MFMRIVVCIGLAFFIESWLHSFESFDQAREYVSLQYQNAVDAWLQKQNEKVLTSQQEELFVKMFRAINKHHAVYLAEIAEDIKNLDAIILKHSSYKMAAQQEYFQKIVDALRFYYRYAKKHRSFYRFLHKINAQERGFDKDCALFQDVAQLSPGKFLGERDRIYENAKYPVMEYADKIEREIKRLSLYCQRSSRNYVKTYLEKVIKQGKMLHAKVLSDKDYRDESKRHHDLHPKRLIAEKTLVATFASLWMGAMIVTAIVYAAVFTQS